VAVRLRLHQSLPAQSPLLSEKTTIFVFRWWYHRLHGMSQTKGHRDLASEMRKAQLRKEQREPPRRAQLKMETTLAVAEWVNGG
jgi:hypothetical protein